MAISGKGFFQVTDKDGGVFYTRAGDFRPDNAGVLRTPAGMALMGYKFAEDGTKGALSEVTIDKFAKIRQGHHLGGSRLNVAQGNGHRR